VDTNLSADVQPDGWIQKLLLVHHFRAFGEFLVSDLAQVNLLVGLNNRGKTCLLEAIELLVGGDSSPLFEGSVRRGEVEAVRDQFDRGTYRMDLAALYHGRRPTDDAKFVVSDGGERLVRGEFKGFHDGLGGWHLGRGLSAGGLVLRWSIHGEQWDAEVSAVRGASSRVPRRLPYTNIGGRSLGPRVWFMGAEQVSPEALSTLFDRIVGTDAEQDVLLGIRLVDPSVERLIFKLGVGRVPMPFVIRKGEPGPVPLGSLGDGAARLLALCLYLVDARGGVLLVDECDAGLHHTVMQPLWRTLVGLALRGGVQVFATTHSQDLLRGLADFHDAHPELGQLVRVHRIDGPSGRAVSFSAGEVALADQHGVELRGEHVTAP
jgi:hypothetical protein